MHHLSLHSPVHIMMVISPYAQIYIILNLTSSATKLKRTYGECISVDSCCHCTLHRKVRAMQLTSCQDHPTPMGVGYVGQHSYSVK